MDAACLNILKNRKQQAGLIYKQSEAILLDGSPADPEVDVNAMSARFTISTPTPDRSEDSVSPLGCSLKNYQLNPVVYFDHGFGHIAPPIAKSADDDGKLTVVIEDGSVIATAFFSKTLPEAYQIFGLVAEKILRAASIRFTPLVAKVRSAGSTCRPGLDVEEWDLIEWSVVGIPDNPEAVRKLLDKNKLAGSQILEPIYKSLLPYAAPVKKLGRGLNLGAKTVAKKAAKPEDEKPVDEVPADQVPADEVPADEPVDETPVDEVKEGEPAEMPLGATVMQASLGAMSSLADQIEMSCRPMENPTVKDRLMGLVDMIRGECADLKAVYASTYPDFKMDEPAEDTTKEAVQKFLAGSRQKQTQFVGLAYTLNRMANDKSVPKGYRESLGRVAKSLDSIAKDAKQAKPAEAASPEADTKLAGVLDSISKTQESLRKALDAATPQRRRVG